MVESEAVWRALTSPHRRRILDMLRDAPLTTGQICKQMPELSRFGVMQHLDVLVEAQLVLIRREGRQRFNYMNAVPMRQLYDRWVSRYASPAANAVQHLKRYAESEHQENAMNDSTPGFRVVKIELEVEIAATPQKVFDALTCNLNDWWPHRFREGSTVTHDARVGGLITETWPDGGAIYGTITLFDAPRRISSIAQGFMGACTFANDDVVEARGEGTVYKKSLRIWGEVPEDLERMFREGSAAILHQALKSYCEGNPS
jgi:DNA-binding transcriptional ArsR family regulator